MGDKSKQGENLSSYESMYSIIIVIMNHRKSALGCIMNWIRKVNVMRVYVFTVPIWLE